MNKLAIFCEGKTEIEFLKKLIESIARNKPINITENKIKGGSNSPRLISTISAQNNTPSSNHYILLVNCSGHHQVATRINEEKLNLKNSGYSKIIGMRDVYPCFSYSEVPKLKDNLKKQANQNKIPTKFILSIMEIEAWFLAEYNHFSKISPRITLDTIKNKLLFNPRYDDMSQRKKPAEDLSRCYKIANITYNKLDTSPTINALNFSFLLNKNLKDFKELNLLINEISSFIDTQ